MAVVLWFRNDLRLHDNAALVRAVELAKKTCRKLLPLYVLDDRFLTHPSRVAGIRRSEPARTRFLVESLRALKETLRDHGSDLLVLRGLAEVEIPKAVPQESVVVASTETTSEEHAVEKKLEKAGLTLERIWGSTLVHFDDLPFDVKRMPEPFTSFRNAVERNFKIREPLPIPDLKGLTHEMGYAKMPLIDDLWAVCEGGDFRLAGGEQAALERLEHYLFETGAVSKYFETRNGQIGLNYSTKFSPWLAVGALSPRTIYQQMKIYEGKHGSNKSTYWVIFELLWRDFFRFFSLKHGDRMFYPGGTTGRKPRWSQDEAKFSAWCHGQTGVPMIDANMRELKTTGFMSNRGRQIVASFLCFELELDWRLGAEWFEANLMDHDVCSNWGNWLAAANMTGGRQNRFNVQRQAEQYDGQGEHVKRWVPELRHVPQEFIHTPHTIPPALQQRLGFIIGEHYPHRADQAFSPPRRDRSKQQNLEQVWTKRSKDGASKHPRTEESDTAVQHKQTRRWKQHGA
jgi:deoxyribodipyrimidine photo-lyase